MANLKFLISDKALPTASNATNGQVYFAKTTLSSGQYGSGLARAVYLYTDDNGLRYPINTLFADKAGALWSISGKKLLNAGAADTPVYFNNGIPTSVEIISTGCGGTGLNEFTANRLFYSSDAGTMAQSHYVSSSAIHVNGTTSPAEGYVFQVNGKTKLSDALSATTISASGDITTSGAITATGNIQGNYIQGTWLYTSAATELEMSQVTKIALIHTNNYIYYIAPASLKVGGASLADVATNALAADKLNTSKGDKNTPVYFSNGIPKACTGLDLDTSGNAATATALRSPKDNATLSYLDYTDSTQTCDYFAVWDNTTYSGKPTVRAMNASYMRSNLDVPSRSGVGASGDWGINITGNAATVTTRTLTIGDTGKNYNGSAAVSWSASEIGYRHEWTATVKGATWSRLCKVVYGTNVIGSKYILNIGATRGNVVYNDTFIITAHHSQSGKIIKIAGNNYTSGY